MQSGKRSLGAGVLLFVGIMAIVIVVFNFLRLYYAMPSKSEVINFATTMSDTASEAGIDVVGSLVPDDSEKSVGESGVGEATVNDATTAPAPDWLSPEQRRTLSRLGIDEATLPTTLTPELEACFIQAIGEVRVEAIKAGDSPTVIEGMKAVTCL